MLHCGRVGTIEQEPEPWNSPAVESACGESGDKESGYEWEADGNGENERTKRHLHNQWQLVSFLPQKTKKREGEVLSTL